MVHGRAVRVELPGQLARVGVLGDRRVGPDVAHQHGHDHALGLADALPATAELLGEPAGQQPGQRLALLLAVDDGLVQQPEPVQRRRVPGRDTRGQLDEDRLHLGADRLRGNPPGHGDRLDRLALGDHAEQLLLGGGEPAGRGDRPDQRVEALVRPVTSTIAGSSAVPPVAIARMASASWLPSATRSFSR
jgi:hypothetical protein